jgi:hypothetical protein
MATTTNYSWSTPDDTALVKDGAAAIRSLGTAIDTTVFTNAGAAIAKATVDAKGDLIAGTADNTVARLAVGGTNGHVLQVDSSTATGLAWAAPAAGGMTLLSTTTLSGASTSISVAGGYNYIQGVVFGVTNASTNGRLFIAPNGTTNLSNATGTARYTGGAATVRVEGYDNGYLDLTRGYDTLRTSADNAWYFTIYNYTSSTRFKPFAYGGTYIDNDSAADVVNFQGAFRSNTAITTLDFSQSGGNFSTGTVLLYGVK